MHTQTDRARAQGDVWRKEGHLLDLLDTRGLDFLTALSRYVHETSI
jgi:hypothetical protein